MIDYEITQEGAERLAVAIYKTVSADLISLYRCRPTPQVRAEIRRLERWLRDDPYCFLSDPDGIIRACQVRARMRGRIKIGA